MRLAARYSVPRGSLEHQYSSDLLLSEDGEKWRDAIEFVYAGHAEITLDDFWQSVRDEYLRSGGRFADSTEQEVIFE